MIPEIGVNQINREFFTLFPLWMNTNQQNSEWGGIQLFNYSTEEQHRSFMLDR
jgi:hypothetical protein